MFETMVLWWLRWIYGRRLLRILTQYRRHKRGDLKELNARVSLLNIRLYQDYMPSDGLVLDVTIGCHTAEQLINTLDDLSTVITNNRYAEAAGRVGFERKQFRFNDWLVNNRNTAVPITQFVTEFQRSVIELHQTLAGRVDDTRMHGYYIRKTGEFVIDLFTVLEALEKLAKPK